MKLSLLFSAMIAVLVVSQLNTAAGKVFNKCSLAQELARLGVPRAELPDWVCMAQYESRFDTGISKKNKNGSKDWGIFQINDRFWCNPGDGRPSTNTCKLQCQELLSDDITKAFRCAQLIKTQRRGFAPWYAWLKFCQNSKPSIVECFK